MATVAELRPCQVALVRVPHGRHGAAVVVEKRLAASVRRIDHRYLNDPRSKNYPIRKGDTGAYNCRKTTSGSSWSKHSYGCAVDVNWQTNGYGARTHDLPAWYVQLWLDEGWGWGGNWTRVKDWMHFSKFPNEGGDGILDGAGPEEEEDFLGALTEEQQKDIKRDTKSSRDIAHGLKNLRNDWEFGSAIRDIQATLKSIDTRLKALEAK